MSILDRYGIKEVADVTFYEINKTTGKPSAPALYLDTLKVSTIEQTGEMADARGGKGNPKLITWDYGKEINVTLEDALFSAKSMAIMFGNGQTKTLKTEKIGDESVESQHIMRTEVVTISNVEIGKALPTIPAESITDIKQVLPALVGDAWSAEFRGMEKKNIKIFKSNSDAINISEAADVTGVLAKMGIIVTVGSDSKVTTIEGDLKIFVSYDVAVKNAAVIEISANTFPGTYYVTGDTYARSDISGDDEFFQFIIPKAKVTSENTITLEAEGDPSVFNMNLTVLRPADGIMMKLVKYDLGEVDDNDGEISVIDHNHVLSGANTEDIENISPSN